MWPFRRRTNESDPPDAPEAPEPQAASGDVARPERVPDRRLDDDAGDDHGGEADHADDLPGADGCPRS